jgi:folate-binding protein YgfZ
VSILKDYLNSMKFMLRVEVRDASSEVALLRAPGIENEIGGPYALVPRSELAQMIETFNTTSMQIGSWALDAMRVASGRPRLGFDTDAKAIPNELGMLNKSVHMKKGCYRGQETVAKIANLGKPPRRLTMLHLDGSGVSLPTPNSPIIYNEKEVGYLGTVARHHELGTIALAVIKRAIPADALLTVDGIPASQELIVPAE